MAEVEAIQARYVAELRALMPQLSAWWERMIERHGEEGVWTRWPTGMAGHPRVLAIFRDAWFAIEAINDRLEDSPDPEPPEGEALWGGDDDEDDADYFDHADWLIHSIGDEAPDLEELVEGLCYVPIGEDLEEEPA